MQYPGTAIEAPSWSCAFRVQDSALLVHRNWRTAAARSSTKAEATFDACFCQPRNLRQVWANLIKSHAASGVRSILSSAPRTLKFDRPVVVALRRWIVPNVGRQLVLERCIHGVAEQFH